MEDLCRRYTLLHGELMTNIFRDILIHILSDDPCDEITENVDSLNSDEQTLISDINTRKKILLNSKTRMDAIFAHSPQPILILNLEGIITDINLSFLNICGKSKESCIGKPVSNILPGFVVPTHDISSNGTDSEIFTIEFPSGKRVLEQYPIPVTDKSGTLNEIILIFKDITIRVKAEEKAEEIRQKLAHDYGERVKEQKLFYSVASLIQDDTRDVYNVLQEITYLIPPGWQYPEETAARIIHGDAVFATENYVETPWFQRAHFKTSCGKEGIIEVYYLVEKPVEHEGPFLLEERNLINSLAEMLKTFVDRKEGERELERKIHDLGERVKEQQLFYSTASLIQDDSRSIQEILGEIVLLIPPGW